MSWSLAEAEAAEYAEVHSEEVVIVCEAEDCGEQWCEVQYPDEPLDEDEFTCPSCGRQTGRLA